MKNTASWMVPALVGVTLLSQVAYSAPLSHQQTFIDDVNGHDYFSFTYDSVSTADNRFVYSISGVDDAINIMERDTNTLLLSLIDTVLGDEDTGDGVSRPEDILMTPDESHLYVLAGSPEDTDDSIFVYARNASTGAITEVQEYSARGLAHPARFTVSEDGQFLYVVSINSYSVTVLQRAANGTLSEVQFITEVDQVFTSGYDYTSSVVISPDQNHVYVGMWVGPNSSSYGVVVHFERNPTTGALSYVDQVDYTQPGLEGMSQPSGLTVSPDGENLYVTYPSSTEIFEFNIDASGSLGFLGTANIDAPDAYIERLYWPNNILLSENGHLAYVTDSVTDSLLLFHRDVNTGELSYLGAEVDGKDGVPELRQNERVVLSPDSRFAYVGGAHGFAVFDLTLDLQLSTQVTDEANGSAVVEVTINNVGPVSAHHVQFQFQVDSAVSINTVDPFSVSTQCSIVSNLATCAIDRLNANAIEVVTLAISSDEEGSFDLSSTVTSDEIDDNGANNTVVDAFELGQQSNVEDPSGEDRSSDGSSSGGGGSGGSLSFGVWLLYIAFGVLRIMPGLKRRFV